MRKELYKVLIDGLENLCACIMTSSVVVTEMRGRNKRSRDRCTSANIGATLLEAPMTV